MEAPSAKAHRPEEGEGAAADRKSRWSDGKYFNNHIPPYLPSELLIFDNGAPLELFLQRAAIDDARRIGDKAEDPTIYFMRRDGLLNVEPRYDASGTRTNTYPQMLRDKVNATQRGIHEQARRFNKTSYRGEREIVKKIFFTAKQIEEKQYGAILGSRGQTHKMLEKETGARIVLGGKGITLTDKAINLRNYERTQDMLNEKPHCRITAPSETSLQKCVERIEWILSDAVEAIKFRDKMRMQLAKDNGTFDAATWEPTPIPGQTANAATDDKDGNDVFAELDEL